MQFRFDMNPCAEALKKRTFEFAKVMSDPALPALIDEANELSAIFNQSQFTAKMNQRSRTAQPKGRQLNPPFQSTNPNNPKFKSPNS